MTNHRRGGGRLLPTMVDKEFMLLLLHKPPRRAVVSTVVLSNRAFETAGATAHSASWSPLLLFLLPFLVDRPIYRTCLVHSTVSLCDRPVRPYLPSSILYIVPFIVFYQISSLRTSLLQQASSWQLLAPTHTHLRKESLACRAVIANSRP